VERARLDAARADLEAGDDTLDVVAERQPLRPHDRGPALRRPARARHRDRASITLSKQEREALVRTDQVVI